jgi:hypothetical protein
LPVTPIKPNIVTILFKAAIHIPIYYCKHSWSYVAHFKIETPLETPNGSHGTPASTLWTKCWDCNDGAGKYLSYHYILKSYKNTQHVSLFLKLNTRLFNKHGTVYTPHIKQPRDWRLGSSALTPTLSTVLLAKSQHNQLWLVPTITGDICRVAYNTTKRNKLTVRNHSNG